MCVKDEGPLKGPHMFQLPLSCVRVKVGRHFQGYRSMRNREIAPPCTRCGTQCHH